MAKRHLHRIATESKILKVTADGQNVPFFILAEVLGSEPGDNAVGSQEVQNPQPFDRRRDLRRERICGLLATRDVGVSRLEGHQTRDVEVLDACVRMATNGRQGYGCEGFDWGAHRTMKHSAERVALSVKVEAALLIRAHERYLDWLNWSPILFHLRLKFNSKAEAQDFVLGRLSLCARVRSEDHRVPAWFSPVPGNVKIRLVVGKGSGQD